MRYRFFLLFALLLGAISLPLTPASSAVYPGCSEVASPGVDVEAFLNGLSPGAVACFAPGNYRFEKVAIRNSGNASKPITIKSADPTHPATLHGTFWISDSANYWRVSDLNFDGRSKSHLPSPIINGDHSIWRDNDITNYRAGSIHDGGNGICFVVGSTDTYGYAVDTIIERNKIHNCGASSNHNHGIYIEATAGKTWIRDNWIYSNGDRGIQLYPNGDGVIITHNLIDRNGSGIIFSGIAELASDHVRVNGNIISNSRVRWNIESYYDAPPALKGIDNLVFNNCMWASNPHDKYYNGDGKGIADQIGFSALNNRLAQPLFRNARKGDYFQLPSSPCRGFGPRFKFRFPAK